MLSKNFSHMKTSEKLNSMEFSNFQKFGRSFFEFSKYSKSCLRIFQFHYYCLVNQYLNACIFWGKCALRFTNFRWVLHYVECVNVELFNKFDLRDFWATKSSLARTNDWEKDWSWSRLCGGGAAQLFVHIANENNLPHFSTFAKMPIWFAFK